MTTVMVLTTPMLNVAVTMMSARLMLLLLALFETCVESTGNVCSSQLRSLK